MRGKMDKGVERSNMEQFNSDLKENPTQPFVLLNITSPQIDNPQIYGFAGKKKKSFS